MSARFCDISDAGTSAISGLSYCGRQYAFYHNVSIASSVNPARHPFMLIYPSMLLGISPPEPHLEKAGESYKSSRQYISSPPSPISRSIAVMGGESNTVRSQPGELVTTIEQASSTWQLCAMSHFQASHISRLSKTHQLEQLFPRIHQHYLHP